MKLPIYIQIIRLKNLAIVAISQILIYLVYLLPAKESVSIELDGYLWILFVLDTVLIAASGYVINDILDGEADAQNKPERHYIGHHGMSRSAAWIYYIALVIVGFLIALFIAYSIDKILLLSIYPFVVTSLYLYSKIFKRMPLIGNIVVSLFCAFVPAIIWYAEFDTIQAMAEIDLFRKEIVERVFIAYILFAFFSTMVREIIKDIEDVEGDRIANYKTLPVVAGVDRANVFALFFCMLLIGSYWIWLVGYTTTQLILLSVIVGIGLVVPTLLILRKIYRAKKKHEYTAISKRLKYLMVVSLFIFLCIPFVIHII
ncbi:MAG: geranylgeranylglycerol-phosphate geranylgeranyltransferase [Saprospiraceae bacterium]|nr:geranylgeranylglycerol-phosphate geranylgeranyltransferase [Saprospiraceae bacterium]